MEQVTIIMNGKKHTATKEATPKTLKRECGVSSVDELYRVPTYEEITNIVSLTLNDGDEFVTCAPEGVNS